MCKAECPKSRRYSFLGGVIGAEGYEPGSDVGAELEEPSSAGNALEGPANQRAVAAEGGNGNRAPEGTRGESQQGNTQELATEPGAEGPRPSCPAWKVLHASAMISTAAMVILMKISEIEKQLQRFFGIDAPAHGSLPGSSPASLTKCATPYLQSGMACMDWSSSPQTTSSPKSLAEK